MLRSSYGSVFVYGLKKEMDQTLCGLLLGLRWQEEESGQSYVCATMGSEQTFNYFVGADVGRARLRITRPHVTRDIYVTCRAGSSLNVLALVLGLGLRLVYLNTYSLLGLANFPLSNTTLSAQLHPFLSQSCFWPMMMLMTLTSPKHMEAGIRLPDTNT